MAHQLDDRVFAVGQHFPWPRRRHDFNGWRFGDSVHCLLSLFGLDPAAAHWKKCEIGTFKTRAARKSSDALIRFLPLSYFWICWKVMPNASPSFACERLRLSRAR